MRFDQQLEEQMPDERERKTVVVLGGTGFVGSSLCRLLASNGHWRVVVATRNLQSAQHFSGMPNVVVEKLDVFDANALRQVLNGASAVVNFIAILHGDKSEFHRMHVWLPELIASECARSSGTRLLHVSALGIDFPGKSDYLQSKAEGEKGLLEVCPQATVLRPSVIFGTGDRFINTFARLQRFAPFVPLACSQALFQPVWVEDVARAISNCLDMPSTAGHVYECAGPAVLTLQAIVARAGEWAGVRRPIVGLPLALAYVQAWFFEHLPGEPLMSRDNLRSMQTPNVASQQALSLLDLGITPTSLDAYLARR